MVTPSKGMLLRLLMKRKLLLPSSGGGWINTFLYTMWCWWCQKFNYVEHTRVQRKIWESFKANKFFWTFLSLSDEWSQTLFEAAFKNPINCYHYCHLYVVSKHNFVSWLNFFTRGFHFMFFNLPNSQSVESAKFCFFFSSSSRGNWMNKEEKGHKIKWHYLKLVFMRRREESSTLWQWRGRLPSSRSLSSSHSFPAQSDKIPSIYFAFTPRAPRRRMILPNPSKWYREMWLKIGGEPRCIFVDFCLKV